MRITRSECWVPWKSRKCSQNTEPFFQTLKSEFSRLYDDLFQSKSPSFPPKRRILIFLACIRREKKKDRGVPRIWLPGPSRSSQCRVPCSVCQGGQNWGMVFCGWWLYAGKNGDKVKAMCGRSGQSMMTEGELTMQSASQSYNQICQLPAWRNGMCSLNQQWEPVGSRRRQWTGSMFFSAVLCYGIGYWTWGLVPDRWVVYHWAATQLLLDILS